MKKFLSYTRYSSALQNQTSIERQDEANERTANREGGRIVKKFSDEAKSGKSVASRKGFQTLIKEASGAAKNNECDGIIVEDWKRWGRNLNESLRFWLDMDDIGVPVHTIGSNHKMIQMFEMYGAQTDNEERSKNVRANQEIWSKKGFHLGGPAPFGYTRVPISKNAAGEKEGGKLIYHPEEGKTIDLIFDLWKKGDGTRKIASELNLLNHKTRNGHLFNYSTIAEIVKNPIYCGYIVRGRTKRSLDGTRKDMPEEHWTWCPFKTHHAYIEKTEWLHNRRRISHTGFPEIKTAKNLLMQRIICGCCGSRYVCHVNRGNRKTYKCATMYQYGREQCPNAPNLLAPIIEEWVIHALVGEVLSRGRIEQELKAQKNTPADKTASIKEALASTEKAIENIVSSIANLASSGGSEALETALSKEEKKKAELEDRLALVGNTKPVPRSKIFDMSKDYIEVLQKGGVGQQRRLLDDLGVILDVNTKTITMSVRADWWNEMNRETMKLILNLDDYNETAAKRRAQSRRKYKKNNSNN